MNVFSGLFRGKRVFLTGHTGFKGSWLAYWLHLLGAQVAGYSLEPPTNPSLFAAMGLEKLIKHQIGDVRNFSLLKSCILEHRPDFLFHLAAQPLVRLSYDEPQLTYEVNVMGTINVMEAMRSLQSPCAAVMITTDKCYENQEWLHGYRENDPLGGYDPYSSSKAAAEIAIAAYRRSFFQNHPVSLASARAGNVIGGGDWAKDRIIPDCIRSLQEGKTIIVRNKTATRPWQHVLEPLSGYLWLAAVMTEPSLSRGKPQTLASAFNFGPDHRSNRTVEELVKEVLKHSPGTWEDKSDPNAVHEASLLQLSIDKANHLLNWSPVWNFSSTIKHTVSWYVQAQKMSDTKAIRELTQSEIELYESQAHTHGVKWALGD